MNANNASVYVQVLIASGDTTAAMAALRAVEGEKPPAQNAESVRSVFWMAVNDTVRALAAMTKATDAGEIFFMTHPLSDPGYDSVRGSAGFAALLKRLGLSASIATLPSGARAR